MEKRNPIGATLGAKLLADLLGVATAYVFIQETMKAATPFVQSIVNAIPSPNVSIPKSQIKNPAITDTDVKSCPVVLPLKPIYYDDRKICATADFTPNKSNIKIGERLTTTEAIERINMGGNVICDDQGSAYKVASFYPEFTGPEIDKWQIPGRSYYWHYHPDRNSHRHIWFFGVPR